MPAHRFSSLARRLGLAAVVVCCPGWALAHYPWLKPASHAPVPGAPLAFSIGWGHVFPGTDTVAADRVMSALLLDGAGELHEIALAGGQVFETPPLSGAGPWILAARLAPTFYSRTPRGGQRSSRAENPDAVSCGQSTNAAKALLGGGSTSADHQVGHPLEIVPLAPAAGTPEPFPVRVLFKGRPWQGEINAVYAGFEGAEGEYPLVVTTDSDGVARLSFEQAGYWMIKASASEPYPDPAVCDQSHFNATLTLVVN